jgi:hypothetical protein
MQTAGDLVALSPELAARVKLREYDLNRRAVVLLGHEPHRNPAAVIGYSDRPICTDGDVDTRAIPRQGFVHRVVHHFVHEVMQTSVSGGTDVHARSLADRLQTLEDLDVAGVV